MLHLSNLLNLLLPDSNQEFFNRVQEQRYTSETFSTFFYQTPTRSKIFNRVQEQRQKADTLINLLLPDSNQELLNRVQEQRQTSETSSTFSYQTPIRSSSTGFRSIDRKQQPSQPSQPSPTRLQSGSLQQGLGVQNKDGIHIVAPFLPSLNKLYASSWV